VIAATYHFHSEAYIDSQVELDIGNEYIDTCISSRREFHTSCRAYGILSFGSWVFRLVVQCDCSCLRKTAYLCDWILAFSGWKCLGCSWYIRLDTLTNFLAKDYNSLLGARILQGFGTGPFEMLVPSSIGDMYFTSKFTTNCAGTLSIKEEHE
jgi:MFS family permease